MVVVLVCLGAVANELMCSQWERIGMHSDVHCSGKCSMRPETNVFHYVVRTSFWCFWIVGSCFHVPSTQQFSPSAVMAITCDKWASADAWVMISQNLLGLLWAKLRQSAFSSLATRRILTDWEIMELVLNLVSDKHSSEDKDIASQSDRDTDDVTDTKFTQCTDSTNRGTPCQYRLFPT